MRSTGSWPDEEVLQDRDGKHWHFVYLYDGKAQRLFFWSRDKISTGVAVFTERKTMPYTRIRDLMKKLVASRDERLRYEQALKFPLQRYYLDSGPLSDATVSIENEG